MRQKKSLESAEFERKLFEQQAKDLEEAIEARREELIKAGEENQKALQEESEQVELGRENILEEQVYTEDQELQNQIQADLVTQNNLEDEDVQQEASPNSKKKEDFTVSKPRFPTFMLPLAIFKDLFDILLTLTGVGVILVMLYSFFYNINLFIWTRGKNTKGVGNNLKHKPKGIIGKYITTAVLELFPGIGMAPLATWFVLNVYKSELDAWAKNNKK